MQRLSPNTLFERVDELVKEPSTRPRVWGVPGLSVTPMRMAVDALVVRLEALEAAVREIAVEIDKLVDR